MNVVPVFRMPRPVLAARAGMAAALFSIMLGTTGPTFGQTATDADPVLATVNGTPIRASDLRVVDEIIGRNLLTRDPVERQEGLLKIAIDNIALAQVANERKIGDDADTQRWVTFARNQSLMNHLLQVVGQQAVTEEAIRKTYEERVVKAANDDPEVHLHHLIFLIKDTKSDDSVKEAEARAKAALKRIKDGEDFAAVASDVSDDPTAKASKGDYGWHTRAEMGKEYADAAFTLKKGEISPVIKSAVGWHIIKVDDQRVRKPVPLEKIRNQIASMLMANAQLEFVEKTRAATKVERSEPPAGTEKTAPKSN